MASTIRRVGALVPAIALLLSLLAAPVSPARAATTLVVGSAADSSSCGSSGSSTYTLRCAINAANAIGSSVLIQFNITSGCSGSPPVCTISPTSPLPTLSANTSTIDGYSEGGTPNSRSLNLGDNAVIDIRLDGPSAGAGANGLAVTGKGDTIKGLSITGFSHDGILFAGSSATGGAVAGNFIGVTPGGLASAPNGNAGVEIASAAGSDTIGGATLDTANIISGNHNYGVEISGTTGNTIQGNLIGVGASLGALGNLQNGVYLFGGASGDVVGGTAAGAGNVIANGGGAGVLVGSSSGDTVHAAIEQNVIKSNGGLGIDLAPIGLTCSGSGAGSPNDGTPCPTLTSVSTSSVTGTSTCISCRVEVFTATNETSALSHGGSLSYVGSATVQADTTWTLVPPSGSVRSGEYVTATVTTVPGNVPAETSEFATNAFIPIPITGGAWTQTCLPIHNNTIESLQALVASLEDSLGKGTIQAVATYANGAFRLFVPGFSQDVKLDPSQGFFVLSQKSGDWSPDGEAFTAGILIALDQGWNMVATPYPATSLNTDQIVQEVRDAGAKVQEIAYYTPNGYVTWTPNMQPFDLPTASVWLEVNAPALWTPA